MSTVKFGTLCDMCGDGSTDYAHDANYCEFCGFDLCDECAKETGHVLAREEDEGRHKEWSCEEAK